MSNDIAATHRFSIVEREAIMIKAEACLWTKQGKPGLDYLQTTRALSEEVIKKFRLGYMPHTVKHKLCGRIIFPFFDPSGNLIALSTRIVPNNESFLPAYWHESYEKSFYLYGIDIAKSAMKREKYAVVVEGQIDALQCHNHGLDNAVAVCSGNFSDMQLAIIYRYCDEVVIVFDRDANQAGQKATIRAMERLDTTYQCGNLINQYQNPKFKPVRSSAIDVAAPLWARRKIGAVDLGADADPDEFIKQYGVEFLKHLINEKLMELRNRHVYY